jgi:hypothetical protein
MGNTKVVLAPKVEKAGEMLRKQSGKPLDSRSRPTHAFAPLPPLTTTNSSVRCFGGGKA